MHINPVLRKLFPTSRIPFFIFLQVWQYFLTFSSSQANICARIIVFIFTKMQLPQNSALQSGGRRVWMLRMENELNRHRIYLIHATPVSIEPINRAFSHLWPEAVPVNLLEDSLSRDLLSQGGQTGELMERFLKLCQYAAYSGADAVLFNCSSFSASIDYCKKNIDLPVFKPEEAMIEKALEMTPNIGLVATFAPAVDSIREEFSQYAEKAGRRINFQSVLCPRALQELHGGNISTHDRLIAESVSALNEAEVICFAQFSMSSAAQLTGELSGKPVLTTPESAVMKIRRHLLVGSDE
jgi:Asp/Glu/hydantoin racemase